MIVLKSVWEWLDGKKSVISALAGLALSWAVVKGYVDEGSGFYLASGLTVITGIAVGHKITKSV